MKKKIKKVLSAKTKFGTAKINDLACKLEFCRRVEMVRILNADTDFGSSKIENVVDEILKTQEYA